MIEHIKPRNLEVIFADGIHRLYLASDAVGSDPYYILSEIDFPSRSNLAVERHEISKMYDFLSKRHASELKFSIISSVSKYKIKSKDKKTKINLTTPRSFYVVKLPDISSVDVNLLVDGGYDIDDSIRFIFTPDLCPLQQSSSLSLQKYSPHSLVFTNAGTGKTEISKRLGSVFEQASIAGLIGFSSADTSREGELNGKSGTVSLDEISEFGSIGVFSQFLGILDQGSSEVVKGKKTIKTETTASIRFMGNPPQLDIRDNESYQIVGMSSQFARILIKIGKNSEAFGRRVGIVLFSDKLKRTSNRNSLSVDSDLLSIQVLTTQKKNSEKLAKMLSDKSVLTWLESPYSDDYAAKINKLCEEKDLDPQLKRFFSGHLGSFRHARGFALRYSIVTGVDKEVAFEKVMARNLLSFALITKELAGFNLSKDLAINFLKNSPDYIRGFIRVIYQNVDSYCKAAKYRDYSVCEEFDFYRPNTLSRKSFFERLRAHKDELSTMFSIDVDFGAEVVSICVNKKDHLVSVMKEFDKLSKSETIVEKIEDVPNKKSKGSFFADLKTVS